MFNLRHVESAMLALDTAHAYLFAPSQRYTQRASHSLRRAARAAHADTGYALCLHLDRLIDAGLYIPYPQSPPTKCA